ncbi:hypothetical protein SUGI_1196350 [Cryptomeria japonica]|uniref:inactive protein RESTRICTED TEV MOVEMENT 2 n=1 Tax=Cryptomeria japonica TaxID=3369 RepID=UPI0024146D0C|nr:inactive protein RESTRICTED TEV MOVEMENT 2 [Cryptomeria japonica]GLJ55691.1 hypothetical protein SUGI_1196350 [Cryptomeria japonica]
MDVNLSLGVTSGSVRRAGGSGSLIRRTSSQLFVEPEFEPNIEWVDTPEAHVLVADLPGFKKEDVKVQLDAWENLIISGERRIEENVFAGGVWHRRQRTSFRFKKVFTIPENANTADVTARFDHEMFYITIKKLRPPQEVRSNNILDQESKSIPQVSKSDADFIEESKEIKDDKASSNKSNQFLKDEKVETPAVAKSGATQDGEASSNKVDQNLRDKKVKNLEAINFIATQDDKASSNKHDQRIRDEKVETKRVALSSATQDEKSLSNKLDQSPRDEDVEIQGVTKSSKTQYDKSSCNEIDQIPREEKIETPEVAKSSVAQGDKASSNKPNKSPRDEKVEISEVTKSGATQIDDERPETPKVIKSITTQDAVQKETQLEAPNKLEDLDKHPSLLNKEKLVGSNSLSKPFELLDFGPKEANMKVGDQNEHKLVENVTGKSNPPHEDHIQETKVSSVKAKKEDKSSNFSHKNTDKGGEEKQSILKYCPYVSQFISSRSELMFIAFIIIFSLALYIICRLTHLED